jgi:hypothetical protein
MALPTGRLPRRDDGPRVDIAVDAGEVAAKPEPPTVTLVNLLPCECKERRSFDAVSAARTATPAAGTDRFDGATAGRTAAGRTARSWS